MARKPLRGNAAANVLAYGTGTMHIDATRVGWDPQSLAKDTARRQAPRTSITGGRLMGSEPGVFVGDATSPVGRWPSNVVLVHGEGCVPVGTRKVRTGVAVNRNRTGMVPHTVYGDAAVPTEDAGYADEDGMETVEAWECAEGCPVAEMDAQSGASRSPSAPIRQGGRKSVGGIMNAIGAERSGEGVGYGDEGGASRFFATFKYQAKADGSERPSYIGPVCFSDANCSQITDDMHPSIWPEWARDPRGVCPECGTPCGPIQHPTVKPVSLMVWLAKLVTQPGGVILDLFAGTGTTGEAAILGGFRAILIDKVGAHIPLIEQRVRKYDDPHAMARAKRGERVATTVKQKPKAAADDDGYDLLSEWVS